MKRGAHILGGFVLFLLAGCRAPGESFEGEFYYWNKSGIALTEVNTTGFDMPWAGPGNFPVDGQAVESRGKQRYPNNCTISWLEPKSSTKHEQILALKTIPPEQRKGNLVLYSPHKRTGRSTSARTESKRARKKLVQGREKGTYGVSSVRKRLFLCGRDF